MTAAELAKLQRSLRQMLPDLGISSVLIALKKALPEQTVLYNTVFQLETRLNSLNKDRIRGIIAQEDLDVAYNRISADLLELIDALKLEDFDIKTAESSVEDKAGSILYRIPHTMEVEEEHRCIVRLAFDVDSVIKNIELTKDTVVKDVRVSEVMEVELVDPNATPCFTIRRLNSLEQFLEKNEYTEWIFFVKPLVTGELPLVLKVSVKEIINDKERIREIVLEEVINVVSEPTPEDESTTFQNAGYTISYTSTPDAPDRNNTRKLAMLLVIGLSIVSGILAIGITQGWFPLPEWLAPDPGKSDKVFWDKMYREHTKSSFETYLRAYPDGHFTVEAHRKIDSLTKLETMKPLPPTPGIQPSPKDTATNLNVKPGQVPVPKPGNKAQKPTNPKKNNQNKPAQTNTLPTKPDTAPNAPAPKPVPTPPVETPQTGKPKKSGFTMVSIAGGNFKTEAKGCSGNVLQMQGFKIGMYEVTQADWREIMGTNPSFHRNCSECPVERVSWDEIQRFLAIASQKRGKKYRLPYEIEWEYAASGGQKTLGKKFAGGNDPNGVAVFLNVQESSREVGTKRANELGIFDMSGNVWEWCDSPSPAYLRCAASPSDKKTMRGGSWASRRDNVTIKASQQKKAKFSDNNLGFRLIEE